jgi:hypothetical protein
MVIFHRHVTPAPGRRVFHLKVACPAMAPFAIEQGRVPGMALRASGNFYHSTTRAVSRQ